MNEKKGLGWVRLLFRLYLMATFLAGLVFLYLFVKLMFWENPEGD